MYPLLVALALGAGPPTAPSFWDQKESVSALAYTPDGKQLITAGGNLKKGHVAFWDLATMTRVRSITGTGMVNAVALSPDGKTLVVHSTEQLDVALFHSKVTLWDVEKREERAAVESPFGFFQATAARDISRDGKLLAVGREGGVTLHDMGTGRIVATLKSDERAAVWKVAFSPDGRTVAASCGGGGVRRWDVKSRKALPAIDIGRWKAVCLAFSPDGKRLLVGSGREHVDPG
jgi:WD40 repeat protein